MKQIKLVNSCRKDCFAQGVNEFLRKTPNISQITFSFDPQSQEHFAYIVYEVEVEQ